MAAGSANKTLVIIIAAAVVGIVGLLLALDAMSRPEPTLPELVQAPEPSAPAPRPVTDPDEAQPEPEPEPETTEPGRPIPEPQLAHQEGDDPPHSALLDGPQPEIIEKTWARIREGLKINVQDQKRLYNFGKDNPHDARPQLLLAYDSMNREWHGIAVRMYAIAYKADPRAAEDPSMLTNLVWVAGKYRLQEHREAVAAIKEIYGGAALPAIDEAARQAEEAGKLDIVERLEELRDQLQ